MTSAVPESGSNSERQQGPAAASTQVPIRFQCKSRSCSAHHLSQFPDEGQQFPGNGRFDFVGMKAPAAQVMVAAAEPVLGSPAQGPDLPAQFFLAHRECPADFGRQMIMMRHFDQDPSGVAVSALGDAALFAAASGGTSPT